MGVWMLLAGQESRPGNDKAQGTDAVPAPETVPYTVDAGTRVLLQLINTVSTKNAAEGDRVYLETAFPVLVEGRIVIPPGSYVTGTVTHVKRAGKVKGRAELYVRFDSLTLPNGVTRDFRARVGGIDGRRAQQLDRTEGKVIGDSKKGDDARTVGEAATTGTWIGTVAGSAAGRPGMGAGVGAAAGAAAGLIGVLASRGPDAMLERGSTVEMLLDRNLNFTEAELEFDTPARRSNRTPAKTGADSGDQGRTPLPGRGGPGRFPLVSLR
jgi:type IV secretion system protein VirB10